MCLHAEQTPRTVNPAKVLKEASRSALVLKNWWSSSSMKLRRVALTREIKSQGETLGDYMNFWIISCILLRVNENSLWEYFSSAKSVIICKFHVCKTTFFIEVIRQVHNQVVNAMSTLWYKNMASENQKRLNSTPCSGKVHIIFYTYSVLFLCFKLHEFFIVYRLNLITNKKSYDL